MTKAFIWDLDGTLLDSYDAILAGIEETYAHYGLDFDREGIHSYILKHQNWYWWGATKAVWQPSAMTCTCERPAHGSAD